MPEETPAGAVVFALLQLPSGVDEVYERLDPHLASTVAFGVFLVYYYAKLTLYALIAAFLVHLTARAYWVGLVGLEAVFPHGVRWENSQYGPIGRRFYQERVPPLSTLIARTDDFCSTIFSFAFTIVFIFVFSIFWAGVLAMIALAVSRLLFDGERMGDVFRTLAFLLLIPTTVAPLLDKWIGKKLSPTGLPARFLYGLTAFYYRALFMNLYAPVTNVLFTNVRKKAIYPIFAASFVVLLGAFLLSMVLQGDVISLDSEIYLPAEEGEHSVRPEYYESLRPEGEIFRALPSIQSDVIRDPYVKLFIHYYPRRHNPAIEKRCPGVRPLKEAGLRFEDPRPGTGEAEGDPEAVLQCLAKIHRVSLDGKPLAEVPFRFYTHPGTGLRGIVAYLPTARLSRGSHLLRVDAVPRPEPEPGEKPPESHLIRFWL
ncbi:MAG: hypothetical protein ACLGI9_11485 [Thermoanaerobaculia bacterium]